MPARGGAASALGRAYDAPAARIAALGRTALLGGVPAPVLAELAARARLRAFAPGDVLIAQGDSGGSVLVLVQGAVTVYRAGPHGTRAALAHLRPPAAVGEVTLLDGGPRSASVEALAPTAALELSRAELLAALAEHPAVLDGLLHSLGRLVRRLSDRATDAVLLDLPGRLAKTLLVLAGAEQGSAVVHLSQSRLAELVGCSRQSLNQALGGLADRGLLHIEGRQVVLDDRAGLRRRAGLPAAPGTRA